MEETGGKLKKARPDTKGIRARFFDAFTHPSVQPQADVSRPGNRTQHLSPDILRADESFVRGAVVVPFCNKAQFAGSRPLLFRGPVDHTGSVRTE